MNVKKLFVGGIVAGIIMFLLGWLFYGCLFMDFFKHHQGPVSNLDRASPVFWALGIGNLCMGIAVAYILSKSNASSFGSGFCVAAFTFFFVGIGYDMMMYGTSNVTSLHAILYDVIISTVMSGIAGGVVGVIFGAMDKPKS
jgi:hypothetical protein